MHEEEKVKIHEFLDILFKYVCISENPERVKNEIGKRRAVILKRFLRDYLESTEDNVLLFAEKFLKKQNYI